MWLLRVFFENYTVVLRPGVTGEAAAAGLEGLNDSLAPLYDAYRTPTGFSNRLRVASATFPWGGRERDDDHFAAQAEFRPWAPRESDR